MGIRMVGGAAGGVSSQGRGARHGVQDAIAGVLQALEGISRGGTGVFRRGAAAARALGSR